MSLRLSKEEEVSVDLTRVLNTRVEPKPEVDLLEEVMSLSLEERGQNSLEKEACYFSTVEEPKEFEELGENLRLEAPKLELKQLPPGLKYAFLLNKNRDMPVIISDKLSESESQL